MSQSRRRRQGESGNPAKRASEEEIRAKARDLADRLLHGTPEGRVRPEVSELLRQHMVQHPGKPERAILAMTAQMLEEAGMPFDKPLPWEPGGEDFAGEASAGDDDTGP